MQEKLDFAALFLAVGRGHVEAVSMLPDAGAEIVPVQSVELRGYGIQENSKRHNAILAMLNGHKSDNGKTAQARTSRRGPALQSTVQESYWSFALKRRTSVRDVLPGGNMSVATDILSLRQNRSGSVETLLAAIEWEKAAQEREHILSRHYAVREAADIVLLNVAVHAADALSEPTAVRGTRRGLFRFWRKPRRSNPAGLHQRKLFA